MLLISAFFCALFMILIFGYKRTIYMAFFQVLFVLLQGPFMELLVKTFSLSSPLAFSLALIITVVTFLVS